MAAKRFRVALSFAGEKRAFVSDIAAILARRFTEARILYDKFHEAEFAHRKLGVELPDLYHNQSDLIVVVFCPDYDQKPWTGLEWIAIHDLLSKGSNKEVMLCRFGRARVQGLYDTAGFVELDDMTPDEAAERILERLALNEGKAKDHYTAPKSANPAALRTSVPNNLPRLQPFFGREKELAAIHEALDAESRTWGVLIDGPGGMGKTSLAIRAAYECTLEQFRRIIFLSVKAREMDDDGERQLTAFILPGFIEMLNELARELGLAGITKAPEDQRIRLLLDALRPAQALLILDNLESLPKTDRDALFTFVKRLPQGCKAILTSRRRIGSGSELLILEQLDQEAALETLADLARRNPLLAKTTTAERLTLYKQTGGKPLLLRWVAGQLGRGHCRTFTDALHFLRTCPPDNDPLEFVFGDLAQEFTPEETRVLVALTYFTHPATVEHVSEIARLEREPVEGSLRTLANRSLVVPDQEETTFALVPMVAEFLRRKRRDLVEETGSHLEQRAYGLIVENGYKHFDRFPLLDAAWPTVGPALPLFLAGPNAQLQSVCSALRFFLSYTGHWDEQLLLHANAEARALAAGEFLRAGWRAHETAWIHYLRGNGDAVVACVERAAAHWELANAGAHERASAIRLRGIGYQLKADYAAATTAFRENLHLQRKLSVKSASLAGALSDLGEVEFLSGDLAGAERDFREALRMSEDVNYAEGVAACLGNLAAVAIAREEWLSAEDSARKALLISRQLGRQELIAAVSHRLAEALLGQGNAVEALPHARYAVDIFTRLQLPDLESALAVLEMCERQLH